MRRSPRPEAVRWERELERAAAVAIVEDDEARVGDARRDVSHEDVGRRQLLELERRRSRGRERNARGDPRGDEAERIAAAVVDDGGRVGEAGRLNDRLRGQNAERLGEPLRAPDERDAQLPLARDAGGPERREVSAEGDLEGHERRRRAAEALELAAGGERERAEQRHGPLHGCHPTPSCAIQPAFNAPSETSADGPPLRARSHGPAT